MGDLEALDDGVTWAEMPHLRKVGRYLFFAVCSASVAIMAGLFAHLLHLASFVEEAAMYAAFLTVFLTLRDMSKQWDWALEKRAEAIEALRARSLNEGKQA